MNSRWKALASAVVISVLVLAPIGGAYADEVAPPDEVVAPAEVIAPAEEAAAPVEEAAAPVEEAAAPVEEAAAPVEEAAAPVEEAAARLAVEESAPVASIEEEPSKWVFVCKYVGKPGVNERLQPSDNNPISVSVNSIENNRWDGTIPGWFSDAQDRSYVIEYDPSKGQGQEGEPTVDDCPAPETGPAVADVDVTPPSCLDRDGFVAVTHTHSKLTGVSRDGEDLPVADYPTGEFDSPPPGEYVIEFTADDGYSFNGSKTITLTFTVSEWLTDDDCGGYPDVVTPTWTYVPPSCEAAGSLTFGDEVGVIWTAVPDEASDTTTFTAEPAEDYEFPEDTDTQFTVPNNLDQLDVNDPECVVDYPVPTQFSADPEPPTCATAGSFSTTFLGEPIYTEEGYAEYDFENVIVGVDRSVAGEVTLEIWAKDGYVLTGLSEDWEVTDGWYAVRTIVLPAATGYQDEDPELECFAEIIPGAIVSQCVGSVPYLAYNLDLPQGFVVDSDTPVTITFLHPTDPSQNYVVPNQPLSGSLLWPGASEGPPQQWPGWELLADGTYVETDGNFAWTRAAGGITVRFEVNPTYDATVTYPPESALCANPASVPGDPAALAVTGGVDMSLWGIGAALMLMAGAALLVSRRFARS